MVYLVVALICIGGWENHVNIAKIKARYLGCKRACIRASFHTVLKTTNTNLANCIPRSNSKICDWIWENPPVTHKDDYLEKRN